MAKQVVSHVLRGLAVEQLLERQDFEEDVPEAEHIHPAVDMGITPGKLRRHVKRCPVTPAGGSQDRIGILGQRLMLKIRFTPDLGQAPVQNEHLTETADQNIRRLQVAMDDPVVVGVCNCLANLNERINQHIKRKQLGDFLAAIAKALNDVPQVASAHALHREVHVAVAVAAHFVNRNGARVRQLGRDAGFAEKSLRLDFRLAHLRMQRLVDDFPVKVDIPTEKQLGCPALGHQLEVRVLERPAFPVDGKIAIRIGQVQRSIVQRRCVVWIFLRVVAHLKSY